MSDTTSHKDHVHITSVSTLLGVWGTLLVLTGVTVWVAQMDLGGNLNIIVALAVASVKATLVALFFMHLLHDNKANLVVMVSSLLFFALFVGFTLFDTTEYQHKMHPPKAAAAQPAAAPAKPAAAPAKPAAAPAKPAAAPAKPAAAPQH